MRLLIRKISAYSGSDLLLGVFRTKEDAEAGRREYLDKVLNGPEDPWAKQSYHDVSERDLEILASVRRVGVHSGASPVFVVSSYLSGFGQCVRKFEGIAGSESSAQDLIADLKVAQEDDDWPLDCTVDEVPIGVVSLARDGHQGRLA